MNIKIRSRFRETEIATTPQATEIPPVKELIRAGNKFKVILIQEGLGNLRDCFYYTKQSLQGATQLFEGKKCFADHPTSIDEQTRPERSTRDILGHFENVKYEESEEGRGSLVADLVVLTNPSFAWAQTLISTAIGYAQKFSEDFVGLSINASGEASEVPIDDFMRETEIPASVLSKLQTAQAEGIPMIRVVNSLKDAVSCDLVTEAGAGGKILQMIEQRKNPMKQSEMKKESEKKEEHKEAEMGMEHESHQQHEAAPEQEKPSPMASDKNDDAEPDHDDAEQDKQLFAKMIKQYLGDDADSEDSDTQNMAKHAYDAHKEDGMEHEAAYEAAGKHLKMAMAIGKKMHEQQCAEKPAGKESESHEAGDVGAGPEMDKKGKGLPSGVSKAAPSSGSSVTKESAASLKAQLIQTLGENARLKESLKKYELEGYLDKKLSESKKPNSITKIFREALGAPKSKEQIDQSYKLFMMGADSGSQPQLDSDSFETFVFTEKNSFKKSDAGTEGSFADCMETI